MKISTLDKKKKVNKTPYLFIAPFFLIFLSFSVYPIFYSLSISFYDWNGFTEKTFVGWQNYINVFSDALFFKALSNTLLFMLMIIPFQLGLALLIAVMLSDKQMPFKKAFRLFNFLPYLTTPIALGVIFGLLFDPTFGSVNYILTSLGFTGVEWFGAVWPARALIAGITVWRYTGYSSILFMAGITNINTDVYEAAEIDGANFWQRLFKITMPLLKPVTVFSLLTTLIGCFQIFEEPYMIFSVAASLKGGPDYAVFTGVWYFYDIAFGSLMKYGYGSAIAFCMFIVIAFITIIFNRITKDKED